MYHTPYFIDLVNKGSQLIPDLFIPVPEMFKMPEEFRHRYVPGSQEAYATVVGLYRNRPLDKTKKNNYMFLIHFSQKMMQEGGFYFYFLK